MLAQVIGQAVVIDMAMGDEDVPQSIQIDMRLETGQRRRGGRAGIEEDQFTIHLGGVAMDLAHRVWRWNRKLLHQFAPGVRAARRAARFSC
jgi:hypothetical protein